MNNTACIVPILDKYDEIAGFYPIYASETKIVDHNGKPYLKYRFADGQFAAMELERCGIMTKHQFKHDFFGETNTALDNTIKLLDLQGQSIDEAIRSSATFRFIAQNKNFQNAKDLAKAQDRFVDNSMTTKHGGTLVFPNTWENIKQVESQPYTIDDKQMAQIRANVFDYFGVNEEILQAKATPEQFASYYEQTLEPFAIQFSDVVSKMTYTIEERNRGNRIEASTNRIQFMSGSEKIQFVRDMLDRGIITKNQACEVLNLPTFEGGDVRIIRGEYYNDKDKMGENENANNEE